MAYQEEALNQMRGEIELDESYFGGPRKKKHAGDRRKRGRGAENKVPVFGIKKREDGTLYTQIIRNASKHELLPIIKKLVAKDNTIIYTDKWKSYDGLVLDGYKHKRINHSKTYSNRRGTHVNGIENFWSFSKRRMAKFNGVSRRTFPLWSKYLLRPHIQEAFASEKLQQQFQIPLWSKNALRPTFSKSICFLKLKQ